MQTTTILPDGSACTVINIRKPSWSRLMFKKLGMLNWWLRRPKYRCQRCDKGMYLYFEGNDVTGYGTGYCDRCASFLESTDRKVKL